MKQVVFRARDEFIEYMNRATEEHAKLMGESPNRSDFIRHAVYSYVEQLAQDKQKLEALNV